MNSLCSAFSGFLPNQVTNHVLVFYSDLKVRETFNILNKETDIHIVNVMISLKYIDLNASL